MRGFHQRGEAENERRTERENRERGKETERSFSIGGGAIQSKAGGLWRLAQFHRGSKLARFVCKFSFSSKEITLCIFLIVMSMRDAYSGKKRKKNQKRPCICVYTRVVRLPV